MKAAWIISPALAFPLLLFGCGHSGQEDQHAGTTHSASSAHQTTAVPDQPGATQKSWLAPIQQVDLDEHIDDGLAGQGKKIFETKCVACHQIEDKLVGPSMKGIIKRRSPVWIMNMILDPEGMLREDPTARALLEEYNNVPMLNQNLTQEEARAVLEYLRTL